MHLSIQHNYRSGNNKSRKVIWFNLPFCKLANINIEKYFLNLLDKPLSKIFNINTIKISYSYTNNMSKIVNNVNKRPLDELSKPDIGLVVRVFANRPGDLGSIPGRVIPKTQKMVLDASLLNTQHYKVRIMGKVEQSRERSSALPYTLV